MSNRWRSFPTGLPGWENVYTGEVSGVTTPWTMPLTVLSFSSEIPRISVNRGPIACDGVTVGVGVVDDVVVEVDEDESPVLPLGKSGLLG